MGQPVHRDDEEYYLQLLEARRILDSIKWNLTNIK